MVKIAHAVTAMNAGELTPLLDARVDKDFYGVGLKFCENMIPLTQGPAAMRSGFQYIKAVRDATKRTALIRFQFGLTQAYAIEVGDQYFRIYRDKALVTATPVNVSAITKANPGVITTSAAHGLVTGDKVMLAGIGGMIELNNREVTVTVTSTTQFNWGENTSAFGTYISGGTVAKIIEVATPYTQSDLFDASGRLRLSYAQSADTLYVVHPAYAPRKLTRSSDTSWALATVDLALGPFSNPNPDDSKRLLVRGTGAGDGVAANFQPGGAVTLRANHALFQAGHVGSFVFLEEIYFDQRDVRPWLPGEPSSVVGLQISSDGNVYQHVQAAGAGSGGGVQPTHIIGDAWDNMVGGAGAARHKWRYLHSRWAILRITGFTSSELVTCSIVTYLCNGFWPQQLSITNVTNASGRIRITSASHGYSDGDYVFIASVGGVTAANNNWRIINVTTNTFDLDGSTFAGTWSGGGTVIRYTTWKWALGAFSAARGYPSAVTFYQDRLCFAATTADPDTVWMSESSNYEGFATRDANQITAANAITVTMSAGEVNKIEALQGTPDGLIVFTADSEGSIQQATINEPLGPNNVRAVPLSNYGSSNVRPVRVGNAVMFVQRGARKLREFIRDETGFVSNDVTVRAEHLLTQSGIVSTDWCQEPDAILWAARSDGTLLSFTYQKEQSVFAWCRHKLGGSSNAAGTAPPIVESVCQVPSADGSSNDLYVIVKRWINGATRRHVEVLQPRWVRGTSVAAGYFLDGGLTYSGSPATTISGLTWLIGQTVTILADGKVHPARTVSASGSITLDYAASTVHVGLPYAGRLQLMRPELPQANGSSQGKTKQVKKVTARLLNTNNLKFGPDFSTMARVDFRKTTDPIDQPVPLLDGDKTFDFNAPAADSDAYVCLEQDLPYPFCIVGVWPTVEVT